MQCFKKQKKDWYKMALGKASGSKQVKEDRNSLRTNLIFLQERMHGQTSVGASPKRKPTLLPPSPPSLPIFRPQYTSGEPGVYHKGTVEDKAVAISAQG